MTRDDILNSQTGKRLTQEEQEHIHEIDGSADYYCLGNVCNHNGTDTVYCVLCETYFITPCVSELSSARFNPRSK